MPTARSPFVAPMAGGLIGAAFCLAVFGTDMVPADQPRAGRCGTTPRPTCSRSITFGASRGTGHPGPSAASATRSAHRWATPTPSPRGVPAEAGAWRAARPCSVPRRLGARCYVLQGLFGVLLVRQVTADPALQIMGAALFVQTPALLVPHRPHRPVRPFPLLAAIWIAVSHPQRSYRWRLLAWSLLCAAAAAIAAVPGGDGAGAGRRAISPATPVTDGLAPGPCRVPPADSRSCIVGVTVAVFWFCGYFLVGSATDLEPRRLRLLLDEPVVAGEWPAAIRRCCRPSPRPRPGSTRAWCISGWAGWRSPRWRSA